MHVTSWVLVVSADERRQCLVRAELEEVGFEVEGVSSIEAALSWLGVMRPTMIVVDERLSGIEHLRTAACSSPNENGHAIPMLNLSEAVA